VATVTTADNCDTSPAFVLTSVASNEPDNGLGDGNTVNDIQGAELGTPDVEFQLRSERSGRGNGRTYTIVYTATDDCGNMAEATVYVTVPHDQSGNAIAANGFSSNGRGLVLGAASYFLVVPAREGGQPGGMLNPTRTFVGNYAATIAPLSWHRLDVDGDHLIDLVLEYPAAATLAARVLDDVGLRYEDRGARGFLVPDIFALGSPLALSFPARREDEHVAGNPQTQDVPSRTELHDIRPNPFNPSTTVRFDLAVAQHATLQIYDLKGTLVRTLVNGSLPAGRQELSWDGRDHRGQEVASGVYFVRLVTPQLRQMRRAILLK
jgi:hypothetical protein